MEQSRRGRVNMNIMQVNPPPVFSLGSNSAPVIVSVVCSFVSLCFFLSLDQTRLVSFSSDRCSYSHLMFSSSHSSCCCRWTSEETLNATRRSNPADGRDVQRAERSGRSVTALLFCMCQDLNMFLMWDCVCYRLAGIRCYTLQVFGQNIVLLYFLSDRNGNKYWK